MLEFGDRIIPAYAGKRFDEIPDFKQEKDHPRIRGEKPDPERMRADIKGSSPHTRGKDQYFPGARTRCRIIPAYAGKSFGPFHKGTGMRDHPRIRGEKFQIVLKAFLILGSSPHTRGKGPVQILTAVFLRIIPAYAGKRAPTIMIVNPEKDHPRIRGEKLANSFFTLIFLGSSPHTRGKVAMD